MGNTAPAPVQHTAEQQDLQFLAERFPFGDGELRHIYQSYHLLLEQSESRDSFLIEWGVECSQSMKEDRKTLFQVVESQILPAGWGLRLYQTAFCPHEGDDQFGYVAPNKATSTISDEYTRRRRLEVFFEGIANSSRRGAKQALSVLFQSCPSYDERTECCKPRDVITTVYKLALATSFLKASKDDALDMADYIPSVDSDLSQLDALVGSIIQRAEDKRANTRFGIEKDSDTKELVPADNISLDELVDWCETTCPLLASVVPTFAHQVFFPDQSFPPSRTEFELPRWLSQSSFFDSPRAPWAFSCACFSSALGGTFFRLYASDHDGLSFNRLQNALVGYSGPTLILIRSTCSGVFGAFTSSQWKESKDFYGQSDCFLFRFVPHVAVYRPTGNGRNFMYCNPQARSKGYDKQAHGLGFGGTVDRPRLFLAENFDDNVAASADLTFDNGPLLPPGEDGVGSPRTQFSIESLEVWGVGGDEVVQQALGARDKARAIKEEGIRRARKVDKAQFLDDFRSGAISSKAFAYKDQIDGRADHDVAERVASQKTKY